MRRTTFIGITGSVGKTTTKELLGAILREVSPTIMTFDTQNGRFFVSRLLLRVRPRHRFCVGEISVNSPGTLWQDARVFRPNIAVVLNIARTNTRKIGSLEETAAEKIRLLDAVQPGGTIILNGDDPRVLAMRNRRPELRVVLFGRSPEFDVWADEISATWPARLSFDVHWSGGTQRVTTQMAGEHWMTSALAAITAALCCGISLETAAAALAKVPPYLSRMEPVVLPQGAVLLRDDFNDDFCTLPPALKVLEQAKAQRRILITSGVLDPQSRTKDRLSSMGAMAAKSADLLVFVGPDCDRLAESAIEANTDPERVHSFPSLPAAAEFLRANLRTGDVALLRGYATDHIARLYFAQLGSIACAKETCRKEILCDHCHELKPGLEHASLVPPPSRPFWNPL